MQNGAARTSWLELIGWSGRKLIDPRITVPANKFIGYQGPCRSQPVAAGEP